MPNGPNNATVVETSARRIRALGAYVDGHARIGIDGRKHAHAEVVAIYQRAIDARGKAATLRAQLAEALEEIAASDVERKEADQALRGWVRSEFGKESVQANDFGFPAPKKLSMTVEARALAVARGKATRKARGTMGSRQKEAVKAVGAQPRDVGRPEGTSSASVSNRDLADRAS
jgi:hypothetical protein